MYFFYTRCAERSLSYRLRHRADAIQGLITCFCLLLFARLTNMGKTRSASSSCSDCQILKIRNYLLVFTSICQSKNFRNLSVSSICSDSLRYQVYASRVTSAKYLASSSCLFQRFAHCTVLRSLSMHCHDDRRKKTAIHTHMITRKYDCTKYYRKSCKRQQLYVIIFLQCHVCRFTFGVCAASPFEGSAESKVRTLFMLSLASLMHRLCFAEVHFL